MQVSVFPHPVTLCSGTCEGLERSKTTTDILSQHWRVVLGHQDQIQLTWLVDTELFFFFLISIQHWAPTVKRASSSSNLHELWYKWHQQSGQVSGCFLFSLKKLFLSGGSALPGQSQGGQIMSHHVEFPCLVKNPSLRKQQYDTKETYPQIW